MVFTFIVTSSFGDEDVDVDGGIVLELELELEEEDVDGFELGVATIVL